MQEGREMRQEMPNPAQAHGNPWVCVGYFRDVTEGWSRDRAQPAAPALCPQQFFPMKNFPFSWGKAFLNPARAGHALCTLLAKTPS